MRIQEQGQQSIVESDSSWASLEKIRPFPKASKAETLPLKQAVKIARAFTWPSITVTPEKAELTNPRTPLSPTIRFILCGTKLQVR